MIRTGSGIAKSATRSKRRFSRKLVEQRGGECAHARLQLADRARGEIAADQFAHPGVDRRIGTDDGWRASPKTSVVAMVIRLRIGTLEKWTLSRRVASTSA